MIIRISENNLNGVFACLEIVEAVDIKKNTGGSIHIEYTWDLCDEYDADLCFDLLTPLGWEKITF